MSHDDRLRWDARYAGLGAQRDDAIGLAPAFRPFGEAFPTAGRALDLACGGGAAGVWLACRGLSVAGFDVSAVAVDHANELARAHGVAGHCRFDVVDLDDGIPAGPPVDAIVCQRFRDARLDGDVLGRLAPGGVLAQSALSEVGATPGPYRVAAGELGRAFDALDVLAAGEGGGEAWLLARRRINDAGGQPLSSLGGMSPNR